MLQKVCIARKILLSSWNPGWWTTVSRTCNSPGRPKSDIEMHLRKSLHTSHIFRWFLGLIQVANGNSWTCMQWTCIMNSGPTPCLISRQFYTCNTENRASTCDARQISSTFCQSKKNTTGYLEASMSWIFWGRTPRIHFKGSDWSWNGLVLGRISGAVINHLKSSLLT